MRERTVSRIGWTAFGISALFAAAALGLNLTRPQYRTIDATTGEVTVSLAMLTFGWFGALVVARRPAHPVGWIMCGLGLSAALDAFAAEYAIYGLVRRPGALPGAAASTFLSSAIPAVTLGLLAALLVLFPTGTPLSRRWRWVLWLAAAAFVLTAVGNLSDWSHRGVDLLRIYGDAGEGFAYLAGFSGAVVAIVAGFASLVVRFRRVERAERAQVKQLLAAMLGVVIGFAVLVAVFGVLGAPSELAADAAFGLLIALIPVATGVAILRHHMYDIDRVISRTVAYALLTAALAALYAGVTLVAGQVLGAGVGDRPDWVTAGATLIVAAAFQPARRRLQLVVDRRFDRRRYDALLVVEAFSAQLRHAIDLDLLSSALLTVVNDAVQPSKSVLWLSLPRHAPSAPATDLGRYADIGS